jgi:pyrimidine operon attenuation protein/uracil phosphoribosyltransferase
MERSDTVCTSPEISQSGSTVTSQVTTDTPKCDRCERRKIRERGYAREARLRKKLAQQEEEEVEEGEVKTND